MNGKITMGKSLYNSEKILIPGERGFVGSSIKKFLLEKNFTNIVDVPKELDFRNQQQTSQFIKQCMPDIVIIAAGKVGGILANKTFPAQFIYENLMIWLNLIHACSDIGVKKLIFLGSATTYPVDAPPPFAEELMGMGLFDKNIEPYAIAKVTALKLCEAYYNGKKSNFIPLTLTNLYGPGDHFNASTSHVVASLITKFHEAKIKNESSIEIWGTGLATRDFLFIDDFVEAIHFIIQNIDAEDIFNMGISHLNIATGKEVSINELAAVISDVVGYKGEIVYDRSKPDGIKRKVLDITKVKTLGWSPKIDLRTGIEATYSWYAKNSEIIK